MDSDKKKVLDIVDRDTWYFFENHYLPIMDRYAYHQIPFFLLGKMKRQSTEILLSNFGDIETTRDYAERLKFEFDNEIMPEHFGNYWSLSIKGCSAWFFPNPHNMEVKKK